MERKIRINKETFWGIIMRLIVLTIVGVSVLLGIKCANVAEAGQPITRPPALKESDIPFPIDMNAVTCDILGYSTAEPNDLWTQTFMVKWSNPATPIEFELTPNAGTVTRLANDPDNPTIRFYQVNYVMPTIERVLYLNVTATVSVNGRIRSDCRCWVINVVMPEMPIIFVQRILDNPIIYTKPGTTMQQLQFDWQRLKVIYNDYGATTEGQVNQALLKQDLDLIPDYVTGWNIKL